MLTQRTSAPAAFLARALPLAAAAWLWPCPAHAQQFGQWSWEGSLGGTRRSYRNSLGAERVGSLDETDFNVSLGLQGFVIHPAIARFRLGIDAAISSFDSVRSVDTRRWGFSGSANILPFGNHPISIYGGRQAFSYSQLSEEDPLNLVGVPDISTTLGGRLRLRAGPLGGSLLGIDSTRLGFQDPAQGANTRTVAFADWSRGRGTFARHARLEGKAETFGVFDYRVRDLTATYDQRGPLGPLWRWEMFSSGYLRALSIEGRDARFDALRTSQRFLRPYGRGTLDLGYDGGLTGGSGPSVQSHNVMARYQWRPRPHWTLMPFTGYGLQLAGRDRLHGPQAGLGATWTPPLGQVELSVSPSVGASLLSRSGENGSGTESSIMVGLGVSAGHGSESTLRKEADVSWTMNRFRTAGEVFADLPDLGAGLAGTGTEDFLRGRLALRRRWRLLSLYGYTEASRREPSGTLSRGATVESLTYTLQATSGSLTVTGHLGHSSVDGSNPQTLDARSAALSWRPIRLLSLTASYRTDTRRLTLAPRLDGQRLEAGGTFWVGAFVLSGHYFRTTDERPGGIARTNEGFIVSLGRRFAGLLPFVTGVPGGSAIP